MRKLTNLKIEFIPAGLRTKDDPLGQRAYFAWKCRVVGDGIPEKQYGHAEMIGQVDEFPSGKELDLLLNRMRYEIRRIERMTPAEIKAGKKKEAA